LQHADVKHRASYLSSKLALLSLPHLPPLALRSEVSLDPRLCRKSIIFFNTLDLADHEFSAMANVPISGALAEKYGYLSLSIFSGIAVLVGGAILVAARLVQNREWRAIV
jgi:hypothetical protein